MSKGKTFRIRRGAYSLTVSPHAKGWRFGYPSESGKWKYVTRKTQAAIREAAVEVLDEMAHGGLIWTGLKRVDRDFLGRVLAAVPGEAERRAVLDFLEARSRSVSISAALERFWRGKATKAGEWTPHLLDSRNRLAGLEKTFPGRLVADISFEELEVWVTARCKGRGVKLYIDLRANLIEFWRWCRIEGLVSASVVPVAERLPAAKRRKGERRLATPDELCAVLNGIAREWRPWVVLGAWAGMRPEEVAPKKYRRKSTKRGLLCEEIDWEFGVIRLSEEVVKAGGPRLIPMGETLKIGLQWAGIEPGMVGPVCLRNPTEEKETGRLAKLIFGGAWPKDILRHSYASNRNALLRNLRQVAEEMGTSERMLADHYHNPRARAEGLQWFEGVVLKGSAGRGGWVVQDPASKSSRSA